MRPLKGTDGEMGLPKKFQGVVFPFSSTCSSLVPHPTGRVVRIYVGICVCDASTPRPPSIPPEQLASGSRRVSRQSSSRRVSRQSCSPVDPAQYPARAARQWIPPSIPPERLASGSRQVSCQSSWPVDPAQYPTRAARQWIRPSIPPELARQSSQPVDPAAEYPRVARQWILPSIPYPARVARQWIPPSIPPERPASGSRRVSRVSSRGGLLAFASGSRQHHARAARQSGFA